MQEAYIVTGYRTAITTSKTGAFRFTRPEDIAIPLISKLVAAVPHLEVNRIDDVVVGNVYNGNGAGVQIGRIIAAKALGLEIPGMMVNRHCASGLEAIAVAAARIKSGQAECIIAGGVESVSLLPEDDFQATPSYKMVSDEPDYYLDKNITAEIVARQFNISRAAQDKYALQSHQKAVKAAAAGFFKDSIMPVDVEEVYIDEQGKKQSRIFTVDADDGLDAAISVASLSSVKPGFAVNGTVTKRNISQPADGAAFVLLMSEKMVREVEVKPLSRMVSYAVAGVPPEIMGIGPVAAIPKALQQADMTLGEIDVIELNEIFASQSLAVIRDANLDPDKVNINGGMIAFGDPMGATGATLTIRLLNSLKRLDKPFGMVTTAVSGGQGVAAIFEKL